MCAWKVLILTGNEIRQLLDGRETEITEIVRVVYEVHHHGQTSLPQSSFLRFGDGSQNRIIALPAYIGGENECAGIKWIASFPDNSRSGLERASAVIVLNSVETGLPIAILEGSDISAKRTAASAALAARYLVSVVKEMVFGFVGCGRINYEIARFLARTFYGIEQILVCDLHAAVAERFAAKMSEIFRSTKIECVESLASVLQRSSLISVATTAPGPHVRDLSMCAPSAVILNISLRDFDQRVILQVDNIVDDIEHVCREGTSVHLAQIAAGNTDFIRCSLAEITLGRQPPRTGRTVVFSPFGLGTLDVAVASRVLQLASESGIGHQMDDFLPDRIFV